MFAKWPKPSPTSYIYHQHISSPTFVTDIDVTANSKGPKPPPTSAPTKIAYRSFVFVITEWNNSFVLFLWSTNTTKNTNFVNTIRECIFNIVVHRRASYWSECTRYFYSFFMRIQNEIFRFFFSTSWKTFPRADPSFVTVLLFLFPFTRTFRSRSLTFISIKSRSFPKRADSCPIWRTLRKNAWEKDAHELLELSHFGRPLSGSGRDPILVVKVVRDSLACRSVSPFFARNCFCIR